MKENRQEPLLEIEHLNISFTQYGTGLRKKQLSVVRDLKVHVDAGELVAAVGASGSGKSLLAYGIMGLLPYNASMEGSILFQGKPLTEKRLKKLRGNQIVLVPQSISCLNPLVTIGSQVRGGKRDQTSREKQRELFEKYQLDQAVDRQYPFELSGGMNRRVLLAAALMEDPKLVVADEPTPGLDPGLAKEAVAQFRSLADQGAGVLMITHDLELALAAADRMVVFYNGTAVEEVQTEDFRSGRHLVHPYTRALFRALPPNFMERLEGNGRV